MTSQAERLKGEMYGLGGRVLDLLFPARCVNCKQVRGALCDPCSAALPVISGPACARCGSPLPQAHAPCPECRAFPLAISRIESVFWHEGVAREAIHALKYGRRRDAAPPLALFLAAHTSQSSVTFDTVTSVPLHRARYQERGYNQAELLAQPTAQLSHLPYMRLLERVRPTADQIGLDVQARRTNVADAFSAPPSLAARKTVLLIDDVSTTGATLDACAVALLEAGARAVYGLTVTRPRHGARGGTASTSPQALP